MATSIIDTHSYFNFSRGKDKKFVQIGQQLENHLQDSHKVQISNVGHTIHVEDSTEFDTILGFLKEEQND